MEIRRDRRQSYKTCRTDNSLGVFAFVLSFLLEVNVDGLTEREASFSVFIIAELDGHIIEEIVTLMVQHTNHHAVPTFA